MAATCHWASGSKTDAMQQMQVHMIPLKHLLSTSWPVSLLSAGLPEESSRVSVYWPADDEWYHGEVKDVDDCGRSHVKYDDGQVEILYFAVERYKLAEPIHSKEVADEDSKKAILPLPAVIDLCSSSDDLDDSPEPLLLTDGTRTQHTLQSRDMKAGTVASYRQQTKIGQVPAAERTSVAKKRHRKSRDRGEDQHECQRQHSRKSLTPIKAHRRSSKQDAAQAVIDQQGKHLADAQHTDALPQATQALPLSTQAQMHASGSAEPGTQLDSRLKKLPIHGPRLPDRTRPRNRSPKESASYPTQPAARAETSAVSQSPAPDQAKMPAAPAPQTMTPQPPMAKRIKSEEGAQSQQPMTPVCFAVQSAPVQPLQGCEPAQTKTPAFRPPQSQTPLLPQNTLGAAACSQAQLALQGSAVTVGQPQKLLDLFGAGASLNLQQKQDALEALIASVADGMTNARFLATIDRNQAEAACNISRYYQTVSKLVQRQPADQQGRDVLRVYFSGLFG
ncbi:TPA: hypothetical protein ACH3X2_002375 [Trebouxia sp. C0005]